MIVAQREYNYEYPPYTSEEKEQKQVRKTKKKRKLKNLLLVVFVSSLSVLILYRYTIIYQKSIALDKMEKQIQYTENLNQQLKAQIASLTNPARIEEIAKEKLGMQMPEENQIVYISVGEKPKVAEEKKSEEKSQDKSNFFMRLLGVLNR
ncbi:cell division protein FtsL [Thermoanaerobacter mathranii subsp. mathranii str. A3]|uniref:Cell division protein FtsL n=2 Tax=Thermoanaerobacter TaxID=1754 RepID=A0ABT9M3L6_9THEO|nr:MULTISPECIES: cell division protein FtsL [Thermoanaerobacter]ADH61191.1 cell division protein FtsL [Thermoanaerobacter mathranii subsp. mathranii str. A3]MBT1278808.1 cell division protein FtsL [Thermoanaerobacter sp. CM-CNRG TB177]MDP9750696.1 cell division protein FtsL [Thermoanaerobacter pentosaceus]